MKPKNLIILVVVAAVLAGLAVLTKRDKGSSTPDILGNTILPDLPVNDVAKVVVQTEGATATVERVKGTWVATSKHGYPADFGKVRDGLMKLSELKIGQVARLNSEQCDALKLHPPGEENGGTLLSLYDASGKELASLLLGETHERKPQGGAGPMGPMGGYPDGRFVSTDNGKTVYLVDETLSDLSSTTKDWLETDLLNVSGSDVMEVSITGPERPPVKLKRPEKGKTMELEGLAENEELKTSKMYSIESAISYLRLADLADPALSDEQLGLDKPVVFQAATVKDEIYSVSIGGSPESSSDRYVRIACAMKPSEPEPEKAVETEGQTDEEKKAAEEKAKEEAEKKAKERKETEDKVKELNDKLARWTFVIESYKAESMLTKRADLVEEKEEEKADEDEKAESPKPAEPEAKAPEPAPAKPAEVQKDEPAEKAPAEPATKPAQEEPEVPPVKPAEMKKVEEAVKPAEEAPAARPAKPEEAKKAEPAEKAPAPAPAKPAEKKAPETVAKPAKPAPAKAAPATPPKATEPPEREAKAATPAKPQPKTE